MGRSTWVLIAFLLCACTEASELGWSIAPPAGWTAEPADGERLAREVKDEFFAAVRPEASATVHRSPTGSTFVVLMLTLPPSTSPSELGQFTKRKFRTRVDGQRTIVDLEVDVSATPAAGTIQGIHHDDLFHVVMVTCDATGADLDTCRRAIDSVAVGEAGAGFEWYAWIAIAGAFLLSIGLVGWRMELRKRVA